MLTVRMGEKGLSIEEVAVGLNFLSDRQLPRSAIDLFALSVSRKSECVVLIGWHVKTSFRGIPPPRGTTAMSESPSAYTPHRHIQYHASFHHSWAD